MQLKITMRYYHQSAEWPKSKKLKIPNASEDVHLFTASGMYNCIATLEDSWKVFYETKHTFSSQCSKYAPWCFVLKLCSHKNLHNV